MIIHNQLSEHLCLRAYSLNNIDNSRPNDKISAELENMENEIRQRYAVLMDAKSLLLEARTLYKSVGIEPSRYRPASEALLRRLINGKGLYRVNPMVDWGNLCSLKFMVPVGLYDQAKLNGPITARMGNTGESYEGLGKPNVDLKGKLVLEDAFGPFGNPSSDSKRASVTESTADILFVYYLPASVEPGRIDFLDTETQKLFQKYWPDSLFSNILP